MKKYLMILIVITSLVFTYCSKKEPVESESENIMSLEDYLSLDIWEKEEKAFAFLQKASMSDDLDEINGFYKDAVVLFKTVNKSLAQLNLQGEAEEMNNLQKEICGIYMSGLGNYLESKDPCALENLKTADEKMIEFVDLLKKTQETVSE